MTMALENWFQAGRLIKHKTSEEEIEAIYGVIGRYFKDASLKGLSSDQKYILSYQAALEAAMTLIYCYGYKPTKIGHHYTTWQCSIVMAYLGWFVSIAIYKRHRKTTLLF